MTTIRGFQRVGSTHASIEVRLAITALEAAGFTVQPPVTDRPAWRKFLDLLGFGVAGVSGPRDRLSVDGQPRGDP